MNAAHADWEEARQMGASVRQYEVWLTSPKGLEAMAPFEQIARLEAGNAKLRRKIEKRHSRLNGRQEI